MRSVAFGLVGGTKWTHCSISASICAYRVTMTLRLNDRPGPGCDGVWSASHSAETPALTAVGNACANTGREVRSQIAWPQLAFNL